MKKAKKKGEKREYLEQKKERKRIMFKSVNKNGIKFSILQANFRMQGKENEFINIDDSKTGHK